VKRLIALLLFVATSSYAASVRMEAGGITIVLHTTPYTEAKVLSFIQEPYRSAFRSADVIYQGKPLKACWASLPDRRNVLVADETGDYGPVPMALFKPVVEM